MAPVAAKPAVRLEAETSFPSLRTGLAQADGMSPSASRARSGRQGERGARGGSEAAGVALFESLRKTEWMPNIAFCPAICQKPTVLTSQTLSHCVTLGAARGGES